MFLGKQSPRVLAIGAHPDDIELGAGGFIHRLVMERSADVRFLIMTAGVRSWPKPEQYTAHDRAQEARDSAGEIGVPAGHVEVLNYRDCELHTGIHDLIREIEQRIYDESGGRRFDILLTHAKGDTHRDHIQVYESTISAARYFDGAVLCYQAPSTILNEFRPTFFVSLDQETIRKKDQALNRHISQKHKAFLQSVRTEGMAKSWALFHRLAEGYLEAFEVYKTFWQ